jgi:hypothetical protein
VAQGCPWRKSVSQGAETVCRQCVDSEMARLRVAIQVEIVRLMLRLAFQRGGVARHLGD